MGCLACCSVVSQKPFSTDSKGRLMPATSLSRSILAFTLLGAAITLMGQTTSASRISGSVKDSTGGAVPNAQVTAISQMSKESRTPLTDANGQCVFETAPPGQYTVKV